MRTSLLFVLIAAPVVAQETPKEEPKEPRKSAAWTSMEEGTFTHRYWDFTVKAEGLVEDNLPHPLARVFSGRAGNGVRIEIDVLEHGLDGARAYAAADLKRWKESERGMEGAKEETEPDHLLWFIEKDSTGYRRPVAYRWSFRGSRCFRMTARLPAVEEGALDRVRKTLDAIRLGEGEPGRCLLLLELSRRSKRSLDDPELMLTAARAYGSGRLGRRSIPPDYAQAEALFRQVMASDAKFRTPQNLESLGLAQLNQKGKAKAAVATLQESVNLAKETGALERLQYNPVYNLACAQSRSGDVGSALASLKTYFGGVTGDRRAQMVAHADNDPDLENVRKDERWKAFRTGLGGS